MRASKIVIAIAVLTASIFLLFNKLFASQQIQIILETGQELTTEGSNYFFLTDVIIMVFSAFAIGSTATYLLYGEEAKDALSSISGREEKENQYKAVLPLLRADERVVFQKLMDSKGGMLQNEIVLKTGLSKVKVTRVLAGLERKNLIVKHRHGLTNRIELKS